MEKYYLGLDIGGTWLKGIAVAIDDSTPLTAIPDKVKATKVVKVSSRLGMDAKAGDFTEALEELLAIALPPDAKVCGTGVSTAGVVNYAGTELVLAAPHLQVLRKTEWIESLKKRTGAAVTLINDADAAAAGAAATGYLSGNRTIGVMPVGTGLGFTVWRNGRKWTPQFSCALLGSIYTPSGSYDAIGGVPAILSEGENLRQIFTQPEYEVRRNAYIQHLAGIVATANIIYGTDKILIGGGLADALQQVNFPFAERLKAQLKENNLLNSAKTEVEVMREGNLLPLIGAVLLAAGEEKAQTNRSMKPYDRMNTEVPFDRTLRLEQLGTDILVRRLWKAEQDAGARLENSLGAVGEVVDKLVQRLQAGGRLIYIGCGTSGRLAAIDTVEIGCTFGFPTDRVLTFISGGLADAAIEIESRFEEDASSVPELLLANINANDLVIGISVSGQAYYVQSGLGFARYAGAYTVMIQEEDVAELPFCDKVIALRTGNELLAGSTRMKAGTATKKILNFISTAAMVRLGKVHGSYMTELKCINEKLVKRAVHILQTLFPLNAAEAEQCLKANACELNRTIVKLNDDLHIKLH